MSAFSRRTRRKSEGAPTRCGNPAGASPFRLPGIRKLKRGAAPVGFVDPDRFAAIVPAFPDPLAPALHVALALAPVGVRPRRVLPCRHVAGQISDLVRSNRAQDNGDFGFLDSSHGARTAQSANTSSGRRRSPTPARWRMSDPKAVPRLARFTLGPPWDRIPGGHARRSSAHPPSTRGLRSESSGSAASRRAPSAPGAPASPGHPGLH
jgi:hypothetical protein